MLFPHEILRETRSMVYISFSDHMALVNMTAPPYIPIERDKDLEEDDPGLIEWRKFLAGLVEDMRAARKKGQ